MAAGIIRCCRNQKEMLFPVIGPALYRNLARAYPAVVARMRAAADETVAMMVLLSSGRIMRSDRPTNTVSHEESVGSKSTQGR